MVIKAIFPAIPETMPVIIPVINSMALIILITFLVMVHFVNFQ